MIPGHGLPDGALSSLAIVALLASCPQHLSLKGLRQGAHA